MTFESKTTEVFLIIPFCSYLTPFYKQPLSFRFMNFVSV